MIYEQGKGREVKVTQTCICQIWPTNNQVQSSANMTPKQVEPRLQGDLIIGTIKTALADNNIWRHRC